MKRFYKKCFVAIVILKILIVQAEAYDTDNTHPLINIKAAQSSNNLIETLSDLGFTQGLDSILNSKQIYKWFEEGAKLEDETNCRSKFHFHDPTQPFDSAGLSNILIDTYCLNYTHRSSLVWAQDADNLWSWQKAREYYYQGLISADKTIREQNLASAFRALGQVMHLLADSSVPEHTRNDIHIFPFFDNHDQSFPQIGGWTYETWCKYNVQNLNITATAEDYSITDNSIVSGLVPITNFWDITSSPGYNLNPIGLAEYSNFNFLSTDTIFKNYTYPQKSSTTILNINAEDNKPDDRVYLQGTTSDGQNINHLVSTGYLWAELITTDPEGLDDSRFSLDDKCFEDYAPILVPKAVGYSAGLLNYFFRGNIDFVADINTPGSYVIKNLGTEDVTGTFTLYYDAVDGTRHPVPSDPWSNVEIKASMQSSPVTFTTPTNPVPKIPGEYFLAFNGKMGQEEPTGGSIGAVAGEYISCTQKTDISDYQAPLFSGNNSYESLPYAWITHSDNGTYTLNGYLWILKNPIPLPEFRCFPIPIYGCYWYLYYPASPYANTYAPSDDRYTPELSSPEEFVKVWIDFNGDKTFAENEMVYEGQFLPFVADWYTNQLITIEQPLNISAAGYCQTVMRVALRWGAPPSGPYDTWDYGDVQDFQVDLK